MNRELIGSVGGGPRARRYAAVGAVLVALLAILPTAAATAASPNVCHITGITRAVAKKVFPKLSSVSGS